MCGDFNGLPSDDISDSGISTGNVPDAIKQFAAGHTMDASACRDKTETPDDDDHVLCKVGNKMRHMHLTYHVFLT